MWPNYDATGIKVKMFADSFGFKFVSYTGKLGEINPIFLEIFADAIAHIPQIFSRSFLPRFKVKSISHAGIPKIYLFYW